MEQVPVHEVAPLGAGVGKFADAGCTGQEYPVEVGLRAQRCSPAVNRLRRVVGEAVTDPGSPGQPVARWPPVPADWQVRALWHGEKSAEQGCQHLARLTALIGPDIFEADP